MARNNAPAQEVEFDDEEIIDVLPDDPDEAYKLVQAGTEELGEARGPNFGAQFRPISDIIKDLSRPLPKVWLYLLDKGVGKKLTAFSWFRVNQAFDKYAPGWRGEVTDIHTSEGHIIVAYRITIPSAEGLIYREDVGGAYEHAEMAKRAKGFDPALRAKQQAFKRAAAQFGFGLYLYDVRKD